MNTTTQEFLQTTLQVLLASTWFAIPIVVLLGLMVFYTYYKKWAAKEQKEAERIIVKMNEQLKQDGVALSALTNRISELKIEIDVKEQKLRELKQELNEPEDKDPVAPEVKTIDSKLTIIELQNLARERGIKGYSRMSKEKLLIALK